ncbi:MAG: SH3 domain-containing protein [Anaerolineales bacterium]|nr:SH3 domain-containing protein [Anaerolineales bacterium]
MSRKIISLCFSILILCTSCIDISSQGAFTATPDFVTATLPPPLIPPATEVSTLPTSALSITANPTISPIEGTTTTQVNVRAEPSTVGDSLGIILAFSKVQVIGKDEYGKWYQIIYAESPNGIGWVAVAYVQMDATAQIPVVEIESGSGYGRSGLVIQGINVRSGPGTTYDSLGTLIPNDVVTVRGKDPSGTWMQIEFANSPDGKGWASSEFLQVNGSDSLPVIGDIAPTVEIGTPADIPLTAIPSQLFARQDGDSISAPFTVVIFSSTGARALQVQGDVSAPEGDTEDWLQFNSFSNNILVEVKCSNNELSVELWNNSESTSEPVLLCGVKRVIKIEPAQPYFLHIRANASDNLQYIQYSLKISVVE